MSKNGFVFSKIFEKTIRKKAYFSKYKRFKLINSQGTSHLSCFGYSYCDTKKQDTLSH